MVYLLLVESPNEQTILGSCIFRSSSTMHSFPSFHKSITTSASFSFEIPTRSWRLSVSVATGRNGKRYIFSMTYLSCVGSKSDPSISEA